MNPRIQELKITNYKKKIASEYSFLNIEAIFHGSEDSTNSDFSKWAINSAKSIIKEFSIYNSADGIFENESDKYNEAILYFKNKAHELFKDNEIVIFNIKYSGEYFRIQCPFLKMMSNYARIKNFDESVLLFDKNLTKLISVLRMEYSFEVIISSSVISSK